VDEAQNRRVMVLLFVALALKSRRVEEAERAAA